MGIFSGVLLVSDLDGTVFNLAGELSEENAGALRSFTAQGGRFTVATGRAIQAFEVPRRVVPINTPVILANGALIYDYDARTILHMTPLRDGYLPIARAVLADFPHVAVEAHLPEGIWVMGKNEHLLLHQQRIKVAITPTETLSDIPASGWLKLLFTAAHDDLEALRDWLLPYCEGRYDLMFSHPFLLELQDMRADKGGGAAWLAKHLGLSSEHVYCAGDYQNDLSMLTRYTSFAPRNAQPEVQAAVDRVGPHCDEHFMAWVVERLGERYRSDS